MVSKNPFTKNYTFHPSEAKRMMELLRRVYEVIEMDHLHHIDVNKFSSYRPGKYYAEFPVGLGVHIFNYLQAKDQNFRDIVIRRQKRYRRRQKNRMNKGFR